MGFFEKIKAGLKRTTGAIGHALTFNKIDDDTLEELLEALIMADCGVETAEEIIERLKTEAKERHVRGDAEAKALLCEIIASEMESGEFDLSGKPAVILVVGVNGAGKTTTIGKLANLFVKEGKKVLVGAADTFRAAAVEQLDVWCRRAGAEMIAEKEGADPASVVYNTISAAKAKNADMIIIDTAGRLQNKKNLMDELAKIRRVIARELPDTSVETLLVIDGTTGQNGISQVKEFTAAAEVTAIAVTKLDGTAKGGVTLSVKKELGIPVKLIGVGEKIDDMDFFVPEDFAKALIEG